MCRQSLPVSNQLQGDNHEQCKAFLPPCGVRVAAGIGRYLPGAGTVQAQQAMAERIGLDGYCPVCIVEAKKWEKGSPDHSTVYDGITYRFPNEAIKKAFLANPAKFVPALDGTVSFATTKPPPCPIMRYSPTVPPIGHCCSTESSQAPSRS